MDPAETERVRLALSSQGVRIGQHDADLQDVSRALMSLSTGMEQLGSRLEQMFARVSSLTGPVVSLGPVAASSLEPPAAPPFQPREPFIPTPLRYSGELGRCRQFLHQCDLVFSQQSLTYASDRMRTAYVMSFLSGQASDWAVAISFNCPALAGSYVDFIDTMQQTTISSSGGGLGLPVRSQFSHSRSGERLGRHSLAECFS